MFDKGINDKEVSVKVTFTLFGNHCCHPLVVQGERNSAKQSIGLLINCKQMLIQKYI
jgi:hypothetical protein